MDEKTAKKLFTKEIVRFLFAEQKDMPSLSPDSFMNSDPPGPTFECQLELLLQKGKKEEGAGLRAACSQAEQNWSTRQLQASVCTPEISNWNWKGQKAAIPITTLKDTKLLYCIGIWEEWRRYKAQQGAQIPSLHAINTDTLAIQLTNFIFMPRGVAARGIRWSWLCLCEL